MPARGSGRTKSYRPSGVRRIMPSPANCTRVPNGAPRLLRRSHSHSASAAEARFSRNRLACIGTSRASVSRPR